MAQKKQNHINILEAAIVKDGKAACLDPDCKETIISEESRGRTGTTTLTYWCTRDACEYNKKQVISISLAASLKNEFKRGLEKLSKRAIAGIIGLVLVIGAAIGNYVPGWLGFGENFNDQKDKIEQLEQQNKELQKEIEDIKDQPNTSNANEDLVNSINTKDAQIKALRDSIKQLKNTAVPVSYSSNATDVKSFINRTIDFIEDGDELNAKKNFKKFLDEPKLKNALLANNKDRLKVVDALANSYSNRRHQFTFKLCKNLEDVELLQQFLATFPTPAKDLQLAKVFYNVSILHGQKEKRYKLKSLLHYLYAARDRQIRSYDRQDIDDINKILRYYGLFKFNSNNGDRFTTIEQAIQNGDQQVFAARIKAVENLLNTIT